MRKLRHRQVQKSVQNLELVRGPMIRLRQRDFLGGVNRTGQQSHIWASQQSLLQRWELRGGAYFPPVTE